MKKTLTLLFAVMLISTAVIFAQPCADSVNRVQFTHNGKKYHLIKQMEGYTDAQFCATELGGHLVYINDQAEQTAVYNAIVSAGISPTYTSVFDGGGKAYVWIGANDMMTEGDWRWGAGVNAPKFWSGQGSAGAGGGTSVSGAYHNWGGKSTSNVREPDNYSNLQDAAAICLSSWPNGVAGEWNDIQATNGLYYVIEYETTGIEEAIQDKNGFEIYPNPASDILFIQSDITQKATIQIISMDGKLLKQDLLLMKKQTINISEINAGIYYLRILLESQQLFGKTLIISR